MFCPVKCGLVVDVIDDEESPVSGFDDPVPRQSEGWDFAGEVYPASTLCRGSGGGVDCGCDFIDVVGGDLDGL